MRTKFSKPRDPEYYEKIFIRLMENHKEIKIDNLVKLTFVEQPNESNKRKLRTFQERYNNRKYLNHITKGQILCVNGVYTLIDTEHALNNKMLAQRKYDMLCGIIANENAIITNGTLQLQGQMSLNELNSLTLNELIYMAKELEREINK